MSLAPDVFAQRRARFFEALGGAAAVIPAAPLVTHHADCEWPFRQNSDFWYLTGFDEPDAVALFLPHRPEGERFVLFVQPKEPSAEVWMGFRWGCEGAVERFGADLAHPREELAERLADYLRGAEGIAFRVGKHPQVEPHVLQAWAGQLDRAPRSGAAALGLVAPCPLLHALRLRKSPEEITRMREAARISAEAHELARQVARPGLNERQVQGVIEQHFLEQGARGPAYGSIVAGGDNACVLHYTANNAVLNDGDLLLIDAGCSLNDYYNGDITAPSRSTVASALSSAPSTSWCWPPKSPPWLPSLRGRPLKRSMTPPFGCSWRAWWTWVCCAVRWTGSSSRGPTATSTCIAPAIGWASMSMTSAPIAWVNTTWVSSPGWS